MQRLEDRRLLSTYHVSMEGDDSATGLEEAPWRTLQWAADHVTAGDTVIVHPGTYAGFVMGWDANPSGMAGAPITFHAQDGVIINSRNHRTPDGINLEAGSNHVTIEGFRVENSTGTITRAGIRVVESDHVIVRGNATDGNGTWGINTGFADDLLIENNVASRSVAEHGIYVANSGDRPIIRGNHIWGNRGSGIHMNGDVSMGGDGIISGALVENNTIHDNGASGGSGINCDGVQNSRIQNNLLYNNHASGISLYRTDAAEPAKNNLLVNNTILQASDARWAVNINDGSTGNRVFNNILINQHAYRGAINVTNDSSAGFQSDYNIVDGRFSQDAGDSVMGLVQWRSATGQDAHSRVAAPAELFRDAAGNDYALSDGSPALNAGIALNAPARDHNGTPRPWGGAWDVGALEMREGDPPPGPPSGTGLRGRYFDHVGFRGPKYARIDPTISFSWGNSAPPGLGADTFSIRWTGQVQPEFSETYTFLVRSEEGVRLWVNGRQIIDAWSSRTLATHKGAIALEAGKRYNIRLEYNETGGSASVRLAWRSASRPQQIIPASRLYPVTT